jgi:hypothetical protein
MYRGLSLVSALFIWALSFAPGIISLSEVELATEINCCAHEKHCSSETNQEHHSENPNHNDCPPFCNPFAGCQGCMVLLRLNVFHFEEKITLNEPSSLNFRYIERPNIPFIQAFFHPPSV